LRITLKSGAHIRYTFIDKEGYPLKNFELELIKDTPVDEVYMALGRLQNKPESYTEYNIPDEFRLLDIDFIDCLP
jgi:hypothetical protein